MKIVAIEKPTQGLEDRSGTLITLRAILSQHPEASRFDFQLKADDFREILDAHKDKEYLELSDQEHSWLCEKLKSANFTGMTAGRLIKSVLNAASLEEKQPTH